MQPAACDPITESVPGTPSSLMRRDSDGERRSLGNEAVRYLAASVGALTLDALLLQALVTMSGLAPWLAGAYAYLAGLVLIYWLSVRCVFAKRVVANAAGEFALFAALGVFGLALNSTILWAATGVGVSVPFAKALSAAVGFVANFVTRKLVLFSRQSS